MAYQVVKYRLTAEGKIPSFIHFGANSMHGYYGVKDLGLNKDRQYNTGKRSMVYIGIASDGATLTGTDQGDAEVIPTKNLLENYLYDLHHIIDCGWQDQRETEILLESGLLAESVNKGLGYVEGDYIGLEGDTTCIDYVTAANEFWTKLDALNA
jgi:hypothetical protein